MKIEKIAENNINELANLMLELWPECNFDAELHNQNSIQFHKNIGFREVNRIVSFIKEIV